MCKNAPKARSAMTGTAKNPAAAHRSKAPRGTSSKAKKKKIRPDIPYQNKDITSKMLAEHFKGKSFQAYGLDIPEIRQVLPTNLPMVKANELRLDNLFELADGTVALVDYESEYAQQNKVKYLNYLTGVVNRYLEKRADCPPLRMIVIYTGDISREQVADRYELGALTVKVESAFLSEFDGDEAFQHLKDKVEGGELLSDREQMEFIILSLSYRDKEVKQLKLRQTVELAVRIQDKSQQVFILAGILVFTDKIIDKETAKRIRSVINMTKVDMIYEEEKQQALRALKEEQEKAFEKRAKEIEERTREVNQRSAALRMLRDNQLTFDKISEYSGLDIEVVDRLAAGIL